MHLSILYCSSFRNYTTLSLKKIPTGLIGFTGNNGAGKTNILEAISLLAPGRGLRNAHEEDLQMHSVQTPWAVHAEIEGKYGPQKIGLGHDPVKNRRIVHLNGEKIKSSMDRADIFRCVWLTPAQDRIFVDGASGRRKLLDRWVFSADPAHAGRITRLDRLLAERNRLLTMDWSDPLWFDAIEKDLAETALAVATARVDYLDKLKTRIQNESTNDLFPVPALDMYGFLEKRIGMEPALKIEEDYRAVLKKNRLSDKNMQATTIGPHRSDLSVFFQGKNMPAAECSTGEQKALLVSLFMAHSRLITQETGDAPVLLLDEITAHLDKNRTQFLLTHLLDLGAQIFMTATTDDPFIKAPFSALYHVDHAIVTQTPFSFSERVASS